MKNRLFILGIFSAFALVIVAAVSFAKPKLPTQPNDATNVSAENPYYGRVEEFPAIFSDEPLYLELQICLQNPPNRQPAICYDGFIKKIHLLNADQTNYALAICHDKIPNDAKSSCYARIAFDQKQDHLCDQAGDPESCKIILKNYKNPPPPTVVQPIIFPDIFKGIQAYDNLKTCDQTSDICHSKFMTHLMNNNTPAQLSNEEKDFLKNICKKYEFSGAHCFAKIALFSNDLALCEETKEPTLCRYKTYTPEYQKQGYGEEQFNVLVAFCSQHPELNNDCGVSINGICRQEKYKYFSPCSGAETGSKLKSPDPVGITDKVKMQMNKLDQMLSKEPNPIYYTALKMLEFRHQIKDDYATYYGYRSFNSNLEMDFGGLQRNREMDFTEGIDLLTGIRAIDETLQLGAIGQLGGRSDSTVWGQIKERQGDIALKDIKPLEIRSHPWDEMIQNPALTKPDIFKLVPEDHFVVHFNDIDHITQLEKILANLTGPLESLMDLKESLDIEQKIIKRLGVPDAAALRKLIAELAFVSEDLDFRIKTEYALILKFNSGMAENLAGSFTGEGVISEKVGDYFVIATHQRVLDSIKAAQGGKRGNMYDAKDFHYLFEILDQRREGLVYFSEAFILKLVGPEYRIKAERRTSIIKNLQALQYTVFAYRYLTNEWPKSFEQMVQERYIDLTHFQDTDQFFIDEKGWVRHSQWGDLHDLNSLGGLEIVTVTLKERETYDHFRTRYQQFWRNFFDPIGIAMTLGDQVMLHTIILPLINASEYQEVNEMAGGEMIEFDFIKSPRRIPAIQFLSKMNLEGVLRSGLGMGLGLFMRGDFNQEDPAMTAKTKEYEDAMQAIFAQYKVEKNDARDCDWSRQSCEETLKEKYPDLDTQAFLKIVDDQNWVYRKWLVNHSIKKSLNWDTEEDILGFPGNEVTLGIDGIGKFGLEDLPNFDVFIGLELEKPELLKALLERYVEKISAETLERPSRGGRLGMLGLSSIKPLRNEYNGTEYFMVPTGFLNVYYMFLDHHFYLSISQLSINKLIDAKKNDNGYSPFVERGLDYTGINKNIMLLVDLERVAGWDSDTFKDDTLGRFTRSSYQNQSKYLEEALTLAQTIPSYDGTLKNVEAYYHKLPGKWMGAEFVVQNGEIKLQFNGQTYAKDKVLEYTGYGKTPAADELILTDIVAAQDAKSMLETWGQFKNLNLALAVTEDGLDARMTFNNPLQDTADARFVRSAKSTTSGNVDSYILWGGLALSAMILLFGGLKVAHLLKKRGSDNAEN